MHDNYDIAMAGAQLRAMEQRNEQAAALREQNRQLQGLQSKFDQMQRTEADRAAIEQARLDVERARLKMEEDEREARHAQAEQLKALRVFLADTETLFEDIRRSVR